MSAPTIRRLLLTALAGGVLLLTSVVLPAPAEAQDLTGPAQQLSPVLELISPIAWPACGDAVLVTVAPAALGLSIPPELAALFGPLIVLCGAIPQPDGQRICALDTAAQAAIAEVSKAVVGSPLPLLIVPTDGVAGELVLIGDLVPALGLPLEATVDAVLSCHPPAAPATTTTVAASADTTEAPTTTEVPSLVEPPTFAELQALPPLLPPSTPLPVAVPVRTPTETPITLISEPRFAYPVVMGLPLVLLLVGAFLGRALTRPLTSTRKAP